MPSRTTRQPSSRATLLRNVGFAIAVALGAVGIWLIVTGGNSTQRVEIGVLTGLWGLLLGAICGRRVVLPDQASAAPRSPAPHPADATPVAGEGAGEVAVRGAAPVDRLADSEARLAFEAELQKLLREEVGTAVNTAVEGAVGREIGALRAEIAQLRQELVDKVGGQLRLERIETTRLIGSDLEAMRAEVRRLKLASDPAAFDLDAELADAQLVEDGGDAVAEVHEVVDPAPRPAPPPAAAAAPVNGVRATTETTRIPRVLPEEPAPTPPPTPARPGPQPSQVPPGDDPFASLPRLTPFTEFPLDPVEASADESSADAGAGDVDTAAPDTAAPDTADSRYAGRRHHRDDDDQPGTADPEHASEEAADRRHHRADDGGGDLLARLLAREGVRR